MSTVKALIAEARELILAGNLEAAEAKKNQAAALKALDAIDTPTAVNPADRPQFPATEDAPPADVENIAAKSWYYNQYGAPDASLNQVMTELYGHDYERHAYAKNVDFVRFIRGAQPKMPKVLVYSSHQIKAMLDIGVSVAELKATQIESQDVLGGYLVPEDFREQMVSRIQGMTAMRKVATVISTTRDRVTMPVSTGGDSRYIGAVRVFKVDESPTGSQSATNATFGQVTIPVHTMMGNVAVSKNLLEDSQGTLSILPYLNDQFASAFAVFEDEQYLVGNGVAGPQGVLKDATTGGPYTYAYGDVTTQNSGLATALQGDSFRNLPYALQSQYRMAGCSWIMSRGTVRVTKTLKAGDGTYLWADRNQQLQLGQPPKLEGYDILESEVLAAPTATNGTAYTANVYPVIFIAKGAYAIVDRVGMSIDRYDDSTTAVANSIVLVARRRGGGQVINPWAVATMKVST